MEYMHENGPSIRQILFKNSEQQIIHIDEPLPLEDISHNSNSERVKEISFVFDENVGVLSSAEKIKNDMRVNKRASTYQSSPNTKNIMMDLESKIYKSNERSDYSHFILHQNEAQNRRDSMKDMQSKMFFENGQGNQSIKLIQSEHQQFEQKQLEGSQNIDQNGKYSLVNTIFGFVKISSMVRKFAKNLLESLEANKFSQIPKNQLNIINDKSFFYSSLYPQGNAAELSKQISDRKRMSKDRSSFIENMFELHKENAAFSFLTGSKYVLMPESKIVFLWNMINLMMIIYNVFEAIIEFGFESTNLYQLNTEALIFYVFECFFLMNIFTFNFSMVFRQKKVIQFSISQNLGNISQRIDNNRKKDNYAFCYQITILVCFYLKNFNNKYFISILKYNRKIWIGILGIILSQYWKYFKLFFLVRVIDISTIYREIENKLNIKARMKHYSDLLKLIFLILSVAHFVGCSFRFVGLMEINHGHQNTWISDDINEFWLKQYINCFYWAVVTMVTLGYGDIVPKTTGQKDFYIFKGLIQYYFYKNNKAERIFTIFIVLLSCGMFGYCLNRIGFLIQSIGKDREEFNLYMDKVDIFMKERKFNLQLQLKIRNHFEYKYKLQSKNNTEFTQILDQMHDSLKFDALKEMYAKLIKTQSKFLQNFSDSFINDLCYYVHERNLVPEEYLYQVGDKSDQMYFVLSGEFLSIPKDDQVNRILCREKKNSIIGLYEFLSQQERILSVKARVQSHVAYIEYQDFNSVLQKYPKDYEQFCFIRENATFSISFQNTDIKCAFCQRGDHIINQCKKFQFLPNILKKIVNTKQNEQIMRKMFNRRHFKWNSLIKINVTSQIAQNLIEDMKNIELSSESDVLDTESYQNENQYIPLSSGSGLGAGVQEQVAVMSLQNIPISKQESIPLTMLSTAQNKPESVISFPDEIVSPSKLKITRQVGQKRPSFTQIRDADGKFYGKKKSTKISMQDLDAIQEENQDGTLPKMTNNEKLQHLQFQISQSMPEKEKSPILIKGQSQIYNHDKDPSPFLIKRNSDLKKLSMVLQQTKMNQSGNLHSQQEFMTLTDLDTMKEFEIYFPQQNMVNILRDLNGMRRKKQFKVKRSLPTCQSKSHHFKKKSDGNVKIPDQKSSMKSKSSYPQINSIILNPSK